MPRIDPFPRRLAPALLILMPGLAGAACEPLAASAQRHTQAIDIALDEQNTLLALDGSRIRSWLPSVTVETGTRARPVIWAERVDWSVYAAAPDARIAVTMLRWETRADGRPRLCGIARYGADTVSRVRSSDRASLPRPEAETRFYYDHHGRLAGYQEQVRRRDGGAGRGARHCLRYDEQGELAELSANGCAAARPMQRYVHAAGGRLLRVISYQPRSGDAIEVTSFDPYGRVAVRYRREVSVQADSVPVLGPPYRDRPGEHAIMVLPGPAWRPPALESYHYDWAIVQTPLADGVRDVYAARRDPARVLAQGNSGSNARFTLTTAQRKRVWDAAGKTPGGVQWLWAPGQIHTLLPAMSAKTWSACIDPRNRQPDACEAR